MRVRFDMRRDVKADHYYIGFLDVESIEKPSIRVLRTSDASDLIEETPLVGSGLMYTHIEEENRLPEGEWGTALIKCVVGEKIHNWIQLTDPPPLEFANPS